jgi:hypothetical protein
MVAMGLTERAKCLLAWQPSAIDIRDAGRCHCGAKNSMVFYSLPGVDRTVKYIVSKYHKPDNPQDEQGRWIDPTRIEGGYFCASCGFSNAGSMQRDQYEVAEVAPSPI